MARSRVPKRRRPRPARPSRGLFEVLKSLTIVRLFFAISVTFGPTLIITQGIIPVVLDSFGVDPLISDLVQVVGVLLSIVITLVLYGLYTRVFEDRDAAEISFRGQVVPIAIGLLIGPLLMGSVVLILWLSGAIEITANESGFNWYGIFFGAGLSAGILEEMQFRVALLRLIQIPLGSYIAVVVSAILFGFVHMLNPNATLFSSVAIAIEAGVLLGAVYLATNNLWMAAALHFSWNVSQALITSTVSGIDIGGIGRIQPVGDQTWLHGGAFGVEASIITIILALLVSIPFWVYAIKKKHIVVPYLLKNSS